MASPQSSDGRRNDGTFKFGDLVWARVGSHYLPGHIFHTSLASKSARDRQIPDDGRLLVARDRQIHDDGRLLVSFGDDSYGWYRLNQLLPFERYFQRMLRQATRDPDLLEKTVREALDKVWRWGSLAAVSLRNAALRRRNCREGCRQILRCQSDGSPVLLLRQSDGLRILSHLCTKDL